MTIEEHKHALRIVLKLEMTSETDDDELKSLVEVFSMGLSQEDIESCYAVVQAEIHTQEGS